MSILKNLFDLYRPLEDIIDANYTRDSENDTRPRILVDILCSMGFMMRYNVQYDNAKRNEDSLKTRRAIKLFANNASDLVKQLNEALTEPQIFHEHKCNDELRSILNQMYELAKQVKDTPLSSVEDSKDISTPSKEKTGSISSDGSTTVDADTPDSQKFPKNESASTRPPSPKVF